MEKIMNSVYGAIIYYLIVVLFTFAVSCLIKMNNESEPTYENVYVAMETANVNL